MADFSSHEAPAHKAQSLPVMLPGKLSGRDIVLAQVYGQLKANKPILIYGAAGIGKTALAATLASAYTELPGGALWLNVHDSPLEELIVRVGRAYGIDEITNSENPLGMVGRGSQHPHQQQAADRAGRQTQCPGHQPVHQPLRRRAAGDAGVQRPAGRLAGIAAGKLEDAAAIAMLRQLGGFDASTSDDDLDELVSILDYIPFAIAIAAGTMRLRETNPVGLSDGLRKNPQQRRGNTAASRADDRFPRA